MQYCFPSLSLQVNNEPENIKYVVYWKNRDWKHLFNKKLKRQNGITLQKLKDSEIVSLENLKVNFFRMEEEVLCINLLQNALTCKVKRR